MASMFFVPSAWADTNPGDGTNAIGAGACNPDPGSTGPAQEFNTEYGVDAGCNTTGRHNVGFGAQAGSDVTGILNVAVGTKAGSFVTGQSNTAIGDFAGARITGSGNTSLGSYANNAGSGASITIDDATAVGSRSLANANRGTALGSHAEVTGENSVALGANSSDGGAANVVSIGAGGATRRIINVTAGIADTDGVNVSQLRPLVDGLGGGATINPTTGAVTGPTYNVGGATYNNVGDAITHLQTDSPVQYSDANGNPTPTTPGNDVTLVGAAAGPVIMHNVANGQVNATSTDAVNGSQLYTTNQQVTTNTTDITNLTTQVNQPITFTGNDDSAGPVGIKLGESLAIKGEATTTGTYSGANVKTVTNAATGAISIQLADSPKFGNVTINAGNTGVISGVSDGVDGDDAVNKSQLDEVAAAAGKGWNISAQGANASNVAPGGTVDLNNGDGNIEVGKTAGSDDVTFDLADAITVDSVTAGNSVLDTNGLTVDDGTNQTIYGATGLVIAGGPQITINGIDAGNLKITHVAAGALNATSTDAVNGSQLYATNQAVTNLGDQINNGAAGMFQVSQDHNVPMPSPTGQDSAAGGAGAVASGDASLAVGNGSTASGNNSTALGNGASASGVGSTAIGQGAQASAAGSVALGSGASDGGRGAESYTGKYSGATNNTAGTVSVGNAANGETRTISNVADAKEATDAVNLRQLDGAVQESKNYTDQQVTKINTSVTNIENGSAGMFQVSQDANGTPPKPTGTESVAGGNNAVASGDHSTALGDNTLASADNSVALGHGSVADRANSVAVGSKGHERQITHVAAGTEATDAVNVSQLKASQAGSVQYVRNPDGSIDYSRVTLNPGGTSTVIHNVAPGKSDTDAVNVAQLENGMNEVKDWSRNYTDQRFRSVNRDLDTIGNRANAGVASAMAMASLPQAYAPSQSSVAVALGGFHGEASVAIGLSTVTDSGRYIFKLNASSNTRGDAGVGVGAAMVW